MSIGKHFNKTTSTLSCLYLHIHKIQKGLESLHAVNPLRCAAVFVKGLVLVEGCCLPFVGIHITDQ